jgi:hypothetical protein
MYVASSPRKKLSSFPTTESNGYYNTGSGEQLRKSVHRHKSQRPHGRRVRPETDAPIVARSHGTTVNPKLCLLLTESVRGKTEPFHGFFTTVCAGW